MNKKSVAIVVVWAILIMLSILAMAALRFMGNQGIITEKSIKRIRAVYAAKAGVVKALDDCRVGGCTDTTFDIGTGHPVHVVVDSNAGGVNPYAPESQRLSVEVDY